MIGAVIGDTVGSVYEFDNTKDYNFQLLTKDGIYTDDSVLSFAVAKWLLEDKSLSPERLEEYFVDFGHRYPCPMGSYGGRFSTWLFGPASERKPYGSWGNGSAMRAGAIGWFFDTLEKTEHAAEISASVTHNHPEGIKGAQATAAAVWMAREGRSKDEIRKYITERYGYDLDMTYEELHRSYGWEDSCQKTVPQAIVCFLESTDFEDSIRKAVSIGGDSDTLACINGAIAEAYYKTIPQDLQTTVWERLPLEFKQIIEQLKISTYYGRK